MSRILLLMLLGLFSFSAIGCEGEIDTDDDGDAKIRVDDKD